MRGSDRETQSVGNDEADESDDQLIAQDALFSAMQTSTMVKH